MPLGPHESRHAFQLVDDVLDYVGKAPKSARTSATISARARSRCRWSSRSAAAMTANASSGSRRSSAAGSDRRPRSRHRADDQAPRARRHDQPRPAVPRNGRRRAGAVPRLADEERDGAGRGFLLARSHRARRQIRSVGKERKRRAHRPWPILLRNVGTFALPSYEDFE